MSDSHGLTSGYPAHPSPPSGSRHSSQPQQQQQPQETSDDGPPRRTTERRKADDGAPKTQEGHPPTSSPPNHPHPPPPPPPSSSSTSSSSPKPTVISSSFATAVPKDQQTCAQLSKEKSATFKERRAQDVVGVGKSVHGVQDRKSFTRVDPAERLLMTGEEMAGTKPKRPRGSHQVHMEVDIIPSEQHTRTPRPNGAHRDDFHSHTQEMLTDEDESDEPKRGETIAEIHFYREDTPPSIASLGLPYLDDQVSDYTSVSATVIRKHSLKGPADPDSRTGDSSSGSHKTTLPSAQKLPAIPDKVVVAAGGGVHDDSDMPLADAESDEDKQVVKLRPKPESTSAPKGPVSIERTADVKVSNRDNGQSKVSVIDKKSASKKGKEQEKSSVQKETVEMCKLTPGGTPLEEDWDATYDPNQPLEERLTATVIRRHVKTKTTTPMPSAAKKQHLDSDQEPAVTTESSHGKTEHKQALTTVVHSPSKDATPCPKQDKLPTGKVGVGEVETKKLSTTEETPQLICNKNGVTSETNNRIERIIATELISSTVPKGSKDISGKSVSVKEVVVTVPEDTIDPLKDRNSTKTDIVLQGSAKPPSKEVISIVQQSNAGTKSPSPGKRVSIREPPETVVHDDPEITVLRTSKTDISKCTKDGDSGDKQTDSEIETGTWVEEGRDGATKAEVNGLANPRNSKSCCFCWCCCCSCSCLSVNNNIRRRRETKQQQQQSQQSGNMDHYFNGEGEPQPTLEDIRTWGESFDKLMKCGAGRKIFREFLQCEYSEENILFWLACEDLKKETNPDVVEEKARVIYEDFISILSPREVSLDSRVRDVINKNMVCPTPNTFDEAQLQIYTLMHRDSYPRFVNSPIYRKLAQLPVPSRKGSMA